LVLRSAKFLRAVAAAFIASPSKCPPFNHR
jgi:hypothetical protein